LRFREVAVINSFRKPLSTENDGDEVTGADAEAGAAKVVATVKGASVIEGAAESVIEGAGAVEGVVAGTGAGVGVVESAVEVKSAGIQSQQWQSSWRERHEFLPQLLLNRGSQPYWRLLITAPCRYANVFRLPFLGFAGKWQTEYSGYTTNLLHNARVVQRFTASVNRTGPTARFPGGARRQCIVGQFGRRISLKDTLTASPFRKVEAHNVGAFPGIVSLNFERARLSAMIEERVEGFG